MTKKTEKAEAAPEEKAEPVFNMEKLAAARDKILKMRPAVTQKEERREPDPERLFAVVDDKGIPQGFYSSLFHETLPPGAIEITAEQRQEFMEHMGERALVQRGDGFKVEAITASSGLTWEIMRRKRNAMLTASDWTQMNDTPLEAGAVEKWKAYRQKLRDLPESVTDLDKIKWPKAPE